MRQIIAGNWKMNPASLAAACHLADAVRTGAAAIPARLILCPPFPLLPAVAAARAGSAIALGAQDCAATRPGAHTGEVAAELLADLGVTHIILGHSERRADQAESDATIAAKTARALACGLTPIVCVGETGAQRQAGQAESVVAAQLTESLPDAFAGIIAYEPIWAIGTGLVPTLADITAMHAALHADLAARFGPRAAAMPILYGGSVKPDNAAGILALPHVGGALVGGAALSAAAFLAIAQAAPAG